MLLLRKFKARAFFDEKPVEEVPGIRSCMVTLYAGLGGHLSARRFGQKGHYKLPGSSCSCPGLAWAEAATQSGQRCRPRGARVWSLFAESSVIPERRRIPWTGEGQPLPCVPSHGWDVGVDVDLNHRSVRPGCQPVNTKWTARVWAAASPAPMPPGRGLT